MSTQMRVSDGRNLDANGLIDTTKKVYPCPVCHTPDMFFDIGCYDICQVCGWEDDEIQYDFPDETGANGKVTLNEAKQKWENGQSIFPDYPHPKQKAS